MRGFGTIGRIVLSSILPGPHVGGNLYPQVPDLHHLLTPWGFDISLVFFKKTNMG
jgi:hypothetical protein